MKKSQTLLDTHQTEFHIKFMAQITDSLYKPQNVHRARKWPRFIQETIYKEYCYIQDQKDSHYTISKHWKLTFLLTLVNAILRRNSFWNKVILVNEMRLSYH